MNKTKYFLCGGVIGPLMNDEILGKFVRDCGCKKMLYIGFHHSHPERAIGSLKSLFKNEIEFTVYNTDNNIKHNLGDFDGVYVNGGMEQDLLNNFDENNFRVDFIDWLKSDTIRAYIGSSAGVQILGKKYFSWPSEVSDPENIRDNGLSVFKEAIFEVHFTERGRKYFLDKGLKEGGDLKIGIGLDESTAIIVENDNIYQPEIVKGGVYVYRK